MSMVFLVEKRDCRCVVGHDPPLPEVYDHLLSLADVNREVVATNHENGQPSRGLRAATD